jgi:hypothetical protein
MVVDCSRAGGLRGMPVVLGQIGRVKKRAPSPPLEREADHDDRTRSKPLRQGPRAFELVSMPQTGSPSKDAHFRGASRYGLGAAAKKRGGVEGSCP